MITRSRLKLVVAVVATALVCGSQLMATQVTYTVDPTLSSLSVSGTWYGQSIAEQSAGSLTTSYSGSINADVGDESIVLTDARLTAANSGAYGPRAFGVAGTAQANYGGAVSVPLRFLSGGVLLAIRDLSLNLSSDLLEVSDDGTFAADGVSAAARGALDYAGQGILRVIGGRRALFAMNDLANSAGTGALTSTDTSETLRIPVSIDVNPRRTCGSILGAGGFKLHLEGTIMATREVTQPATPEPATALLLLGGGLALIPRRRLNAR